MYFFCLTCWLRLYTPSELSSLLYHTEVPLSTMGKDEKTQKPRGVSPYHPGDKLFNTSWTIGKLSSPLPHRELICSLTFLSPNPPWPCQALGSTIVPATIDQKSHLFKLRKPKSLSSSNSILSTSRNIYNSVSFYLMTILECIYLSNVKYPIQCFY